MAIPDQRMKSMPRGFPAELIELLLTGWAVIVGTLIPGERPPVRGPSVRTSVRTSVSAHAASRAFTRSPYGGPLA